MGASWRAIRNEDKVTIPTLRCHEHDGPFLPPSFDGDRATDRSLKVMRQAHNHGIVGEECIAILCIVLYLRHTWWTIPI